jgi:hypothetical protein
MRSKNGFYNISFHKYPVWVMMYGRNFACCLVLSCVGRNPPCSGSITHTRGPAMYLGHYIPSYYTSNTIRFSFEIGGTQGVCTCEAYPRASIWVVGGPLTGKFLKQKYAYYDI